MVMAGKPANGRHAAIQPQVPREILGGLDGDAPARAVIEEQDRLIAKKSGQPALAVKSIRRSGAK
jgi:hypothetical protein